jgi:preprotein translocase subunit SecD
MNHYLFWKYLLSGVVFSAVAFSDCSSIYEEQPTLESHGGIYFLMQVDMETAIRQDEKIYRNELRTLFRANKLRYKKIHRVTDEGGGIQITFTTSPKREQAKKLIEQAHNELIITEQDGVDEYGLDLRFSETALKAHRQKVLAHNITIVRNRVKELGIANPVVQSQGEDRIIVQLPGVQDTAHTKKILVANATLEFRLVADTNDRYAGRLYKRRNGTSVRLKRRVVVTGEQIIDAAAKTDQHTKHPAMFVRLDREGAKSMLTTTRENVGKPMAVVFIEQRVETNRVDGKKVTTRTEEVINVATIMEEFGGRFQITGLTATEAENLALLLRAGALKAPMTILEERAIAPSSDKGLEKK